MADFLFTAMRNDAVPGIGQRLQTIQAELLSAFDDLKHAFRSGHNVLGLNADAIEELGAEVDYIRRSQEKK